MRRGDDGRQTADDGQGTASSAAVIGAPASAVARPLDAAAAALAVVLCLSWGFNQVAVKLALPEIPPLIQAAFRSTFGALIVVAWARARGVKLMEPDGTLVPGIIAGVLFGLEFLLIYRGLVWTSASRASLFLYTAPFIVVIGARWLLPGDRFDRWQWAGLVLSFAGMVVAFGVPTPGGNPHELIGDLMLVLAGAAWAATTLLVKATRLVRVGPGFAALPDGLGGGGHLPRLVRVDSALFREPARRVHLPDPAIRDRGRPPGAGRSPDPGLRARGRAGGGGPRIGEPATLTPQAQSGTSPGAFFPASACPF
jgi:uncharacterized membrane protein